MLQEDALTYQVVHQLFIQAKKLYLEKDYQSAIEQFNQLLSVNLSKKTFRDGQGNKLIGDEVWGESLRLLGDIFYKFGQCDQAMKYHATSIELLSQQKNYRKHYHHWWQSMAVTCSPQDVPQRKQYFLHGIYHQAQQYENQQPADAVKLYRLGLELIAQDVSFETLKIKMLFNLAGIFLRINALDNAKYYFQQLSNMKPLEYRYHFEIGVILQRQQKYPEALASFEQALTVCPDIQKENFWSYKALLHAQLKQPLQRDVCLQKLDTLTKNTSKAIPTAALKDVITSKLACSPKGLKKRKMESTREHSQSEHDSLSKKIKPSQS